jgi:hypothetical protein
MNDARSGRAPVSIHIEERSDINRLLLVRVGRISFAVFPTEYSISETFGRSQMYF